MSKKNLVIKILYLIFFIIILLIFAKILINANYLQLKINNNFIPKLYQAKYEPIKVIPEHNINLKLDKNEKIYEFINEEKWQFNPQIKQIKKNNINQEVQYDKKINSKAKAQDKILNYKKHNIHIVKNDSNNAKKIINNDKISLQLGAFTTHNKAMIEKNRLEKLFPKMTISYDFIIEKSSIKQKNIIYRLKIIPFSNISSAKKLCNNLRKKSISCFLSN